MLRCMQVLNTKIYFRNYDAPKNQGYNHVNSKKSMVQALKIVEKKSY